MSRVALIGENSVEYVNALLDIWNDGDCAVLLDWRIPFKTAVKMMVEAGVTRCCIENGKFDNKKDIFPESIELEVFEWQSNSAELLPQYIYDKYRDNYSDNEAVVIYSSGTTGTAKGIILSHYAIQTNADAIIDYMKPVPDDCIYIAKVMSHSSTLTGELLVALKSGMKVVVAPTIVPPRFIMSHIEQYCVSVICLNPTLLSYISDEYVRHYYDLSFLRVIYVSGSVLNDSLYKKAHNILKEVPIYNVYGLSEVGPRVTAQRADCCKGNTVGKPIKNVDVIIVNEHGNILPPKERGIVHVKTPSKFTGYISGERKNQSLCEPWINTGDIGFFDENGELVISGRCDDVINLNSHKIYPIDIEQIICMYPKIDDCFVSMVEIDNNQLIACLYTGENQNKSDIIRYLAERLPWYELPQKYIFINQIPRTTSGKVIKRQAIECLINAER